MTVIPIGIQNSAYETLRHIFFYGHMYFYVFVFMYLFAGLFSVYCEIRFRNVLGVLCFREIIFLGICDSLFFMV